MAESVNYRVRTQETRVCKFTYCFPFLLNSVSCRSLVRLRELKHLVRFRVEQLEKHHEHR